MGRNKGRDLLLRLGAHRRFMEGSSPPIVTGNMANLVPSWRLAALLSLPSPSCSTALLGFSGRRRTLSRGAACEAVGLGCGFPFEAPHSESLATLQPEVPQQYGCVLPKCRLEVWRTGKPTHLPTCLNPFFDIDETWRLQSRDGCDERLPYLCLLYSET